MNFFIPDKIVLNLNNLNGEYEFCNIKKFKEYIISFTSENKNDSNIHLCISQYFSNKSIKTYLLPINDSYICSNYYLNKIVFSLSGNNRSNSNQLHLTIIERAKNLKETTTFKNDKLEKFINHIKSNENFGNFKYYGNIKIASILDEFSYNCFSHDVNIINLSYDQCLFEIESFNPNFLLVESAWNGYKNSWQGKIANKKGTIDFNLYNLINYCNKNNILTVFWNKEDFLNFDFFKNSSSLFDYIFLTDENIIPLQSDFSKHTNIYILEFAAQPKIHNSIDKNKYKLGDIAFAGSWYGSKYLNRLNDMNNIVKPSLKLGVDIFDRNYNNKSNLTYFDLYWPDEYLENIIGSLDYNLLVNTYKNYDLFLNVNSVKNSKHMISRRVYEIIGSKTPVLSSHSECITNSLSDYVYTSSNSKDTEFLIKDILSNNFNTRKICKKNQRFIIENHTYKNRLEYIFDTLNIPYTKYIPPFVFIIGICSNLDSLNNLYNSIINQTYTFINNCIIIDSSLYKNIELSLYKDITIFDCNFSEVKNLNNLIHNLLISHNKYSYYALFTSDYFYSENYIRDYINTLSFAKNDILGKNHILIDIDNNCNTKYIACSEFIDSYSESVFLFTSFMEKHIFNKLLTTIDFLNDSILYSDNTFKIYSDDEFNISISNKIIDIVSI